MATIDRSRAALRFSGSDLDPDELTRCLGREPSKVLRAGEPLSSRPGSRVAKTTSWQLVADPRRPADLDAQVAALLDGLTPDLAVWRDLSARFDPDLFCGLFLAGTNEGLSLSAATLLALAERGLRVELDIYGGHDGGSDPGPPGEG